MSVCPHCGETENFHYNYDYHQASMPVIDILCNECGGFFKPEPEEPNAFSHWREDTEEDIGPFSHWKDDDEDNDSPIIQHFKS